MTHDLRAMCDAVFYVVRDGVEWRALPADFPPWDAVYAFYDRWSARGLPQALVCRLREKLRVRQGRGAQPTASIVDSQIVKAADTVPRASSGYHGGKKITGRGPVCRSRCRGLAAGAGGHCRQRQRPGRAKLLVIRLDAFGTLKIMWADSGYDGAPLAAWIRAVAGITLEVVRRCDPHAFQVVRRRWVVERTFGWLMRYRRLARDYERLTAHHEAMVYWATIMIMTRRLVRYQASQPPEQRWGGNRPQRAAA